MKKEQRRGISQPNFINEHRAHNHSETIWICQKDKNSDLSRIHCACGKTWVGDNPELGIELG